MASFALRLVSRAAPRPRSRSVSTKAPPPDDAPKASKVQPEDAFEKGLPFLFKNNASLITLVSVLGIVMSYNIYSSYNELPEPPSEALREAGPDARKILPHGRIIMEDGSIVRRPKAP